jgi:hypothetical protein
MHGSAVIQPDVCEIPFLGKSFVNEQSPMNIWSSHQVENNPIFEINAHPRLLYIDVLVKPVNVTLRFEDKGEKVKSADGTELRNAIGEYEQLCKSLDLDFLETCSKGVNINDLRSQKPSSTTSNQSIFSVLKSAVSTAKSAVSGPFSRSSSAQQAMKDAIKVAQKDLDDDDDDCPNLVDDSDDEEDAKETKKAVIKNTVNIVKQKIEATPMVQKQKAYNWKVENSTVHEAYKTWQLE